MIRISPIYKMQALFSACFFIYIKYKLEKSSILMHNKSVTLLLNGCEYV